GPGQIGHIIIDFYKPDFDPAMTKNFKKLLVALIAVTAALWLSPALAEPLPWQLGMQEPVSPSAERLNNFHNMLLLIIAGICFLVMVLLAIVILRYNARANPQPAQFAHN